MALKDLFQHIRLDLMISGFHKKHMEGYCKKKKSQSQGIESQLAKHK